MKYIDLFPEHFAFQEPNRHLPITSNPLGVRIFPRVLVWSENYETAILI